MLVVSVIPIQSDVSTGHLDKLVHLGEYLLLAWLLSRALRPEQGRLRLPVRVWSYATGYGLTIELLQGVLPWRSASAADMACNALGAALGVWLGQVKRR